MNWSPYGAVNIIMASGMEPAKWDMHATNALMATLGYIIVFAGIGINKFKWETK
jgi:ABC-2 type transport system permease protein